jgi:hypothetical protein
MKKFKVGSVARMMREGRDYTIFKLEPLPSGELKLSVCHTKCFHVPANTVVKFIDVKRMGSQVIDGRKYGVAEIISGCKRGLGYAILMDHVYFESEGFVPYSTINILGNFPKKSKKEV